MNGYFVNALGNLQEQSHMVASWAVQTGVMVSLLIMTVLILRRPFAKIFGARAAYALWLLPVMRLFMPTVSVPPNWLFWKDVSSFVEMPGDLVTPTYTIPATVRSSPDYSFWNAVDWTALALSVWVIGTVLWLLWQGILYQRARRVLLDGSSQIDAATHKVVAKCAAKLKLKRLPQLRFAHDNRGPMVMGLFEPVIILPRNFAHDFTSAQQCFALLHELAHIKRFDLWAAFAALIFRALNWPNPLVHYAMRAFRIDQEAACDASVLSVIDGRDNRQSYGETLLRAATLSKLSPGQKFTDVPIGLTLNHPLKERLMALKNPMKKTNWLTYTVASAAILAGCAMTAPYTVASAQDDILAGAPSQNTQTMRQVTVVEKDGKILVDEGYEIRIEDGKAEAWEIDSKSGKRKRVDIQTLKDKDGFDFDISKNGIVSLSADRIVHVPLPPKRPNGVTGIVLPNSPRFNHFKDMKFDDFQFHSMDRAYRAEMQDDGSLIVNTPDGQSRSFATQDEMVDWVKDQHGVRVDMENLNIETIRMQAQLQAAQSLLMQMQKEDIPSVERELAKARKALKKAAKALEDAERSAR
ncbi:M56 family metallopeptidase [Fretibacter rubidus]|uniref:M56 family metallopeptidase n=1 Tax=Fretibacter rubidus TaxID=570162 RepID=UPI00352AD687